MQVGDFAFGERNDLHIRKAYAFVEGCDIGLIAR